LACVGAQRACDLGNQGGFSRAIGADQSVYFARPEIKGNIAAGGERAKAFAEA
jgi:hypothetical protein